MGEATASKSCRHVSPKAGTERSPTQNDTGPAVASRWDGQGGDASAAAAGVSGGESAGSSLKPSQVINKKDPPGGSVGLWPGKAKTGRTYNLRVKIFDVDDDWVTFELLEVPKLVT